MKIMRLLKIATTLMWTILVKKAMTMNRLATHLFWVCDVGTDDDDEDTYDDDGE